MRIAHVAGFGRTSFCCCRRRSTITSRPTMRFGSSRPSLMGSISRATGSRGSKQGYGAAGLCARRSTEALHLWLPQPGPSSDGSSRSPAQYRGHLAGARLEARLQDDRGLPTRQSRRLQIGVPPVRALVPAARPLRPRVARDRRNPRRGGQQQRPRLHPLFAAHVHPCSDERSTIPRTARPWRPRRRGDKRRARARISPRRSQRSTRSAADSKRCWRTRANRRGSDLADRSRRPRHGRAYQTSIGYNIRHGQRRARADRRAGGDQPGRGHRSADADRRTGSARFWTSR